VSVDTPQMTWGTGGGLSLLASNFCMVWSSPGIPFEAVWFEQL